MRMTSASLSLSKYTCLCWSWSSRVWVTPYVAALPVGVLWEAPEWASWICNRSNTMQLYTFIYLLMHTRAATNINTDSFAIIFLMNLVYELKKIKNKLHSQLLIGLFVFSFLVSPNSLKLVNSCNFIINLLPYLFGTRLFFFNSSIIHLFY